MRCLFCKQRSDFATSVEHVVPESLGNDRWILPRGAVCDQCNNYFARKVEAPFANSSYIRFIRHNNNIENKRGRIPKLRFSVPGIGEGTIEPPRRGAPKVFRFDTLNDAYRWRMSDNQRFVLFDEEVLRPPQTVVSRFVAKVAVEHLAQSLVEATGSWDYLVDEVNLDAIRDCARRGTNPEWPVFTQRLYPPDARWPSGDTFVQILMELNFLQGPDGSQFVSFVLYGEEYLIHLGEPDISGVWRLLLTRNAVDENKGFDFPWNRRHSGRFPFRHNVLIAGGIAD